MSRTYQWTFPLPRTHTGILQGNGTLGTLIWGGGSTLCITLGRADFWDHRGGLEWKPQMNFADIRAALEANDGQRLKQMFDKPQPAPGTPARPSVLPLGRLELTFDTRHALQRGVLDLETGQVAVYLTGENGHDHKVLIDLSMQRPVVAVRYPRDLGVPQVKCVTAWSYVGDYLKSIGFASPEAFEETTFAAETLEGVEEPSLYEEVTLSGWVQERPADRPVCVGYRLGGEELWMAVDYGPTAADAQKAVAKLIETDRIRGAVELLGQNTRWFSEYWGAGAKVSIPNPALQFLFDYGMYKFAGLTAPHGVAATLQGPWIEEYQMPPWSSDYHFNINVQMCYSPAYRGNHLDHLRPLFDMVWSWRDKLRQNAKLFVGVDDGYTMPHAVDDRGVNMGGFWTGTIDHGCTAWVGKMMFDYYLYGGDVQFLRDVAYPFMVGGMRVYEAMLEKGPDGRYRLPVSVSPEYRGSQLDAWGRNASFQLACIHWLCAALIRASEVLGVQAKPIWNELRDNLPKAALIKSPAGDRIGLWEGTDLEESHRHHSHLAGLVPFDVIDPADPLWKPIVDQSITHWIATGMGRWSGWCMSWASQLHTRMGNADMAELIIQTWQKVFTNQGHGTLHDCHFPGFTLIGAGASCSPTTRSEIMQMDAGMGTTAAILDMLLHSRQGVNYLFAGAPGTWAEVEFSDLLAEGGFGVSARRDRGVVSQLHVQSRVGGTFRLHNPWPEINGVRQASILRATGRRDRVTGAVIAVEMMPGETVQIFAAP